MVEASAALIAAGVAVLSGVGAGLGIGIATGLTAESIYGLVVRLILLFQ